MSRPNCSVAECTQESVCRGWCRSHYNKQYNGKAEYEERVPAKQCSNCGTMFDAKRGRIYCSPQCAEQAKYNALRADPERWDAYLARVRRGYVKKTEQPGYVHPNTKHETCSIEECERKPSGRTLCSMHYKRWQRANGLGRSPSDSWSDLRRSNYHARRARTNGASTSDRVLLAELLLRDGPACSACGEHVDPDTPYPEPTSPSIDHTIPVSRGGQHSMANTTVMHLRCNISKGNKLPEEAKR
jgi:5-methylcytosine-specific restriction endonuclease McrA